MTMHQLQAVEHVVRAKRLHQFQDLGDEQAELGLLAGRVAPAAGAFARELHAHADARAHLIFLGVLQHQRQLFEILDHRNDGAAELGGEDHRLDVAVVLEAVADDHALGRVFGDRHHRQQLGLGAGFEAEAEFLAVAIHFFDHQPLLVHLDREHGAVAVLVVVLGDRLRERLVQANQAMAQDVGEAHHDRRRQISRAQPFDHFIQIDLALRRAVRAHHHVAGGVDAEVALAPVRHLVEIERVLGVPGAVGQRRFCGGIQATASGGSERGAKDNRRHASE